MSQRKGGQFVPRELTGSSQLSCKAECWPWINSGNLGKFLVLHGVRRLLSEWDLQPEVAAPYFGTQSKPGKGIANTLGSNTLSPCLSGRLNSGGYTTIRLASIEWYSEVAEQRGHQATRAGMESHSPQPAFRSGILPLCQKVFKRNHHSQSTEKGWKLVPELPTLKME